jgi:hypothetical protein
MKFIRIMAISLVSTLLFSQTTIWKKDKFTGKSFAQLFWGSPKLEGGSFFSERYVRFTLWAFPNNPPDYMISVDVSRPDWMFISEGESLTFRLDGEFLPLSGNGSRNNRDVVSGGVTEYATYFLTVDQLQKVANAKEAMFRLSGDKADITGQLTPKIQTATATFIHDTQAAYQSSPNATPMAETPNPGSAQSPGIERGSLKAGISFAIGAKFLQVLKVEPWSNGKDLLGKFIVAIEGERGTGPDLQAKLLAAIAKSQTEGAKIRITVSPGPGEPDIDQDLLLAIPK